MNPMLQTPDVERPRSPRPTGSLRPAHPIARRARDAIERGRLTDAVELIGVLADDRDPVTRAWAEALRGDLSFERGELADAERHYLFAGVTALTLALPPATQPPVADSFTPPAVDSSDPSAANTSDPPAAAPAPNAENHDVGTRLAGFAMNRAGDARRRMDRPKDAIAAHATAYALLQRAGSHEDLCLAASNLGLDADLCADPEAARCWHERAIRHADQAGADAEHWRAVAWERWRESLLKAGRFDHAVEAARRTARYAASAAPGSIAQFKAELRLAHAVIRRAEALESEGEPTRAETLADAREDLDRVMKELVAFGAQAAPDLHWAGELRAFVDHLIAAGDAVRHDPPGT